MKKTVKVNELPSLTSTFEEVVTYNWKVSPGTFIHTDTELGTFEYAQGKFSIVSHMPGTVESLPKDSKDSTPLEIAECDHDTSFGERCVHCGEIPKEANHKTYRGFHSKVSFSEARALEEEKRYKKTLFEDKKLMLVLDIDHTLVHTCDAIHPDSKSSPEGKSFIDSMGHQYVVKYRPFLEDFLDTIGPLFDIYVYSHGSQWYAEALARLMDPKGNIIKSRKVLGRETIDVYYELKNLEKLLPADQTVSIIIDDREDVWANKGNLIRIFPYVYFKSEIVSYDRKMYPALPPRSQDCSLFYFKNLLKNIHALFYDAREMKASADVRAIIAFIRAYVLKGIKANLGALGKKKEELYKCGEYKMLAGMGGRYVENVDENTVVLAWEYKEENPTIKEAELKGAKVVDLHWLVLSSRYWWKLPLEPLVITKEKTRIKPDEIALAKDLEKNKVEWKYDFYDEILKGLIGEKEETKEENGSGKKKKIEE